MKTYFRNFKLRTCPANIANNIHGSQAVSIKYVIDHNWELRRKNVIFVTMEN
nr:MAG TPA: hypothetical protein [Caudoviricetes sp.]